MQAQVGVLLGKGEDTRVLALPNKNHLAGAIEEGSKEGVGGMEVEALKGIDLAQRRHTGGSRPWGGLIMCAPVGGHM